MSHRHIVRISPLLVGHCPQSSIIISILNHLHRSAVSSSSERHESDRSLCLCDLRSQRPARPWSQRQEPTAFSVPRRRTRRLSRAWLRGYQDWHTKGIIPRANGKSLQRCGPAFSVAGCQAPPRWRRGGRCPGVAWASTRIPPALTPWRGSSGPAPPPVIAGISTYC